MPETHSTPISLTVTPVFNLAARGNGSLSAFAADSLNAVVMHSKQCEAQNGGCGPAGSSLTDDGWQGTYGYCAPAHDLERQSLEQLAEDGRRDEQARENGTWPQALLSPADRATLAREVLDWVASHPGHHDQATWMGHRGAHLTEEDVTLLAGNEPAPGIALCVASIVCHLAGWDLRTAPGIAHAIGPYRITRQIGDWAQVLLALTDQQARELWHADNDQAARLLGELAARTS
ncbi:hypothetical protein [Streptomyces hydrogenans]|uniref:hypothetical protein n=1 Tax=Streptomyces hydrogenans TaxID=1873719 RepID=UPI0038259E14